MKYLLLSVLAITLSSFAIKPGPKMRIIVVDENSSIVSGAKVLVYASFKDYETEEKHVAVGETNAKGYVEFKNLKEQKYYLLIKKDKMNNHNTNNETDVLHIKGKNRFQIMID